MTRQVKGMGDAPLDDRTLARATLAACVDGPDKVMHALLATADDEHRLVGLLLRLRDGGHGGDMAGKELDALFSRACRTLRGPRSASPSFAWFHQWRGHWCERLGRFAGLSRQETIDLLTDGGRQWILTPDDPSWPCQLNDLTLRADSAPPLCLWGMGERTVFATCGQPVAVVGSRNVNEYGRSCAHRMGDAMAADGHLVISGGAMGIDAAAHWGSVSRMARAGDDTEARDSTGRTVAVFAGGIDHAGPAANHRLFDAILERGGALVSERAPGTVPLAHRFLERNRIIAALAHTIVVAQARLRSGALNTALCGLEMMREVYAVPGPIDAPTNAGCNWAVYQQKAVLLPSVDELAGLVHMRHRATGPPRQVPPRKTPSSPQEHTQAGPEPQPEPKMTSRSQPGQASKLATPGIMPASGEAAQTPPASRPSAHMCPPPGPATGRPSPSRPSARAHPHATDRTIPSHAAMLSSIRGCAKATRQPVTLDALTAHIEDQESAASVPSGAGASDESIRGAPSSKPDDPMATLGEMKLAGLIHIDAKGVIHIAKPS